MGGRRGTGGRQGALQRLPLRIVRLSLVHDLGVEAVDARAVDDRLEAPVGEPHLVLPFGMVSVTLLLPGVRGPVVSILDSVLEFVRFFVRTRMFRITVVASGAGRGWA